MFCYYCGHPIKGKGRFCGNCGNAVVSFPKPVKVIYEEEKPLPAILGDGEVLLLTVFVLVASIFTIIFASILGEKYSTTASLSRVSVVDYKNL